MMKIMRIIGYSIFSIWFLGAITLSFENGNFTPLMKGVYAGGSESKSHYELTKIADGELILTNKRLVFVSSMHNRTFSLDKIFSVRGYTDSIEVSTEGSKKGHIFAVLTPMIWENLIKVLKQIDNPANVPQINVKFE